MTSATTSNPVSDDGTPTGWRATVEMLFGIDLRSMALFRVGLAVIVLLDLADRAQDLVAHYTYDGLLTRDAVLERYGDFAYLLPHFHTGGSAGTQATAFIINAVCALLLLVGFHTRVMTVLCWLAVSSLQMFNWMVGYGADEVIRLCLFWAMFLPIGARFSIDSAVNTMPRRERDPYVTMATFAYLMQICFIYWFAAVFKRTPAWLDGDAVYYALHLDWFVTPFGEWVREQAWLLPWLTWGTLALEGLGPFLLFSPVWHGPIRMLAVLAFMGLHVGFILTMTIHLFPYVSLMCWLPFVPTWFWEHLFAALRTPARTGLRIYYDGTCGFCRRTVLIMRTFFLLPETPLRRAQDDPALEEEMIREHSWIVIDHEGHHRHHFDGVAYVLARSPWAFWLGWLARVPGVFQIGDLAYRIVARNRELAGTLTWPLRGRVLRLQPWRLTSVVVGVLLMFVFLLNVRSLGFAPISKILPRQMDTIASAMRLNQRWTMFSLDSACNDGWFVVPATLADGRVVDLFADGSEVSWEKPPRVSKTFKTGRWECFLVGHPDWEIYAAYLCREWNERHEPAEHVERLSVDFMLERTGLWAIERPRRVNRIEFSCSPESDAP